MDQIQKSFADQPDSNESVLIKFSTAFDEHGISSQLTQIGTELGLSSQQQQQLIQTWQGAASKLKSVPVGKASVADGVMNRITAARIETRALPEQLSNSPKRRVPLAKMIALATSSIAMLYVALHVATHERSLNRSAEVLASFSFDPQGWDVVVLTVSDEQANQLSRHFEQPSKSGDLQMLSLMENSESKDGAVGVMMASKETSERLLVKLADTPDQAIAEWNPKRVGELGRDELLHRFAESMKTPTKSDLYFREVIVVTSDRDTGFHVTSKTADGQQSDQLIADANGTDSTEESDARRRHQKGESMLMQMQNHRQRPVLVVLKRRSEPAPDSQGSTSIGNRNLAAYL